VKCIIAKYLSLSFFCYKNLGEETMSQSKADEIFELKEQLQKYLYLSFYKGTGGLSLRFNTCLFTTRLNLLSFFCYHKISTKFTQQWRDVPTMSFCKYIKIKSL
jgi:hypothetical protein